MDHQPVIVDVPLYDGDAISAPRAAFLIQEIKSQLAFV